MNIKHIIYLLSMFPCFRFNLEYFEQSYSDLPTPNHIRYRARKSRTTLQNKVRLKVLRDS